MISGSCLCGSVQLTLDGDLTSARYCYCTNCTKFAGTAPATWAIAERSKLEVNSRGHVKKFNSGKGLRCFCTDCGSPVWFESLDYPDMVAIPLGVLDDGAVPAPTAHIWTQSKPDWCRITDKLPQHASYPQTPP
ncbi:MAG: GFA family protein [Woeseiaceae bacterium]